LRVICLSAGGCNQRLLIPDHYRDPILTVYNPNARRIHVHSLNHLPSGQRTARPNSQSTTALKARGAPSLTGQLLATALRTLFWVLLVGSLLGFQFPGGAGRLRLGVGPGQVWARWDLSR
jgi:hypothetical protein